MDEIKKKQVEMHKDFFDRCQAAIDNQFYLEAIFLEYAALEGRLEVILGVLGAPCNRNLTSSQRCLVNISSRVQCLKKARKTLPVFEKTKLEKSFFDKNSKLMRWINTRNRFIHGLYKKELEYKSRLAGTKELAEEGLCICRALYNEANRLKRLKKSKPDYFEGICFCNALCI